MTAGFTADVKLQTDKLISALLKQNEEGIVSDVYFGYRCYSLDIITSFCFAQSAESLSFPNFQAPMMEAMEAASLSWSAMKHFAAFRTISYSLPGWLTILMAPAMEGVVKLQEILTVQIKDLIANPYKLQETSHPVIYENLLTQDEKKGTPLNFSELYHESLSLLFAGMDTTSTTLVIGTYLLLTHPEKAERLQMELKDAWPSLSGPQLGLEQLEKLPYLTAICKESLRMAPHISTGFLRVIPASGKKIGGTFIPGGVRIALSETEKS